MNDSENTTQDLSVKKGLFYSVPVLVMAIISLVITQVMTKDSSGWFHGLFLLFVFVTLNLPLLVLSIISFSARDINTKKVILIVGIMIGVSELILLIGELNKANV